MSESTLAACIIPVVTANIIDAANSNDDMEKRKKRRDCDRWNIAAQYNATIHIATDIIVNISVRNDGDWAGLASLKANPNIIMGDITTAIAAR